VKFDIFDPKGTSPELRFVLGRNGNDPLYVIGVNPSTADRHYSDRTIDKVSELSRGWNYDGFVMLNLYPLRCPRPSKLPATRDDKLTAANSKIIRSLLSAKSQITIWAAWGNAIYLRKYLLTYLLQLDEVTADSKVKWLVCGELTKKGNPRHPNPRESLRQTHERGLVHFDFKLYLQKKAAPLCIPISSG